MGKKRQKVPDYDEEIQIPVIKCSICTGEQAAGFKDKHTGKFTEVMLIRDEKDLLKFRKLVGLHDIPKEY